MYDGDDMEQDWENHQTRLEPELTEPDEYEGTEDHPDVTEKRS